MAGQAARGPRRKVSVPQEPSALERAAAAPGWEAVRAEWAPSARRRVPQRERARRAELAPRPREGAARSGQAEALPAAVAPSGPWVGPALSVDMAPARQGPLGPSGGERRAWARAVP